MSHVVDYFQTEGTRPNTGTLSMEPIILKMETTTKKPTTSMSTSTTEGPVTVKGDNHLPTVHSSTGEFQEKQKL